MLTISLLTVFVGYIIVMISSSSLYTASYGQESDITPPVITVPQDRTEEATGPDGAQVSFEVSAVDNIDGPADIDLSCDYASGETFPIDEITTVRCNATDEAGNPAEEFFTISVEEAAGGGGGTNTGGGGGTNTGGGGGTNTGGGGTTITPEVGWVTPLIVLASIVIGGIVLGKSISSHRTRKIKLPPSPLVKIRTEGGISE